MTRGQRKAHVIVWVLLLVGLLGLFAAFYHDGMPGAG
jgi:hypothetical protein